MRKWTWALVLTVGALALATSDANAQVIRRARVVGYGGYNTAYYPGYAYSGYRYAPAYNYGYSSGYSYAPAYNYGYSNYNYGYGYPSGYRVGGVNVISTPFGTSVGVGGRYYGSAYGGYSYGGYRGGYGGRYYR